MPATVSLSPADRFDTASLRAAVLDAWRRSPTRLREDANVEDDYARGAYRDRLLVELAQNAVDAARTAGVPARIRVTFEPGRLVVENTGAPLDRAGVESLASMRASAKRDDTSVGRFGVGFASVLAITDSPAIISRDGGVRFSRGDTVACLDADPELSGKLHEQAPPFLRLPFPWDAEDPLAVGDDEYDTAVLLPWRDEAARERAVEAVAAIDDALFVALPGLAEVVVVGAPDEVPRRWTASSQGDVLTVTADDKARRWRLHRTRGEWAEADLEGVSADQRGHRAWQLTWAVPLDESGAPMVWGDDMARLPAQVVHAPTPTDELLTMPALLVGTFPVDPSRRRLAQGARSDALVEAATDSFVDVVAWHVREHGVAAAVLIPEADLVGPLDGRVRAGVRDRLGRTRWLPRASDRSVASPVDLVAVDPAEPDLVAVLAPHVSDLVDPEWLPQSRVLRGLGLTTRRWSDVWDVVALLDLAPETWHEIYGCAAGLDRASLEGLPVLLAGGRVVRDARQCVAWVPGHRADDLQALGLAVVDATAMHPLLERVGVQPFDPRVHLERVPSLVSAVLDDDESEARRLLAAAVSLLDGGASPGELTGLGVTPVPTQTGEWLPAAQVVLPQTQLAPLAEAAVLLDFSLAAEHREGWLALGVLGALTVVPVVDTPMEPELWNELMVEGGDWCLDTAELLGADSAQDLLVVSTSVVRGVELVDGSDPEAALAVLSSRDVRGAIVEPATVLDALGRAQSAPSPAAWWLSEVPLFSGRAATALRLPGDARLAPFFDEVDPSVVPDRALLEAIGVHSTVESWLERPSGASELLASMADPMVELPEGVVAKLYAALGRCDPDRLDVPQRLRARVGRRWTLVDASEVVVAMAPHHGYVMTRPFIPGGRGLADLLDLDVTDDRSCGATEVADGGVIREVPEVVAGHVLTGEYREHDAITVGEQDVDWWVTDAGEVHACTLDGLAHALAWADGRWQTRWELAARLAAGADLERDLLDSCYDD